MQGFRRRSLLAAGIAGSGLCVLPGRFAGIARAQQPYVRHDVASPQGKQMLKIYAGAVAKMAATTPGDPLSWVFQWYTHWVKGAMDARGKQQELQRIYGGGNTPFRALAALVWDTCQAHGDNEDENLFLPWHRMFVYGLEHIVRDVSGEARFSLPYWNYTESSDHALPAEFRNPNDPMFRALYRQNRNPGVDAGQPIDGGRRPTPLNLDAMKSATYSESGADAGFCANLDFGLHGNVHVMVGNTVGMGAVPWAANDPIFWLHHCMIDRIWASWNKAGGQNPSDPAFLDQSFAFAGTNRQQAGFQVRQVLDTAQLGYTYDSYVQPPAPAGVPVAALSRFVPPATPATVAVTRNVSLGTSPRPIQVRLAPAQGPGAVSPHALRPELTAPGSPRRTYLVLGDFMSEGQPGVVYDVFLDAAPGTAPPDHYAGTMNFFAAMPHGGGAAMRQAPRKISFDVTEFAKNLASAGRLETPTVTFAPHGTPAEGAAPMVGSVALVVQ